MKREIKFRAWDKDKKKMFLVATVSKVYGIEADCAVNKNGDTSIYNAEIMQYTGLKDKNDKEIYEGDIVEYDDETHAVIIWNERETCFEGSVIESGSHYWIHKQALTIIGNIYENPELLKG